MRLLVIAAAFPPLRVGEADHALHLCEHLAARGLEVHVLTTKREGQTCSYPFALHPIMPGWGWSDLPCFATFLRRCSPDVVLLMYTPRDYNYSDMITFAPTITKAVLSGAPFVTQFLTDLIGPQGSLAARAIRKTVATCVGPRIVDYVFGTLLCKSDRVVVLSERHLSALSAQFLPLNGKGMVVIPPPPLLRMCPENNGTSRQLGRQTLGIKPDEFLIAYYGYLYQEKGIEILMKAFSLLQRGRHKTRLVMIGGNVGESHSSPYVDTVMNCANSLGIADRIIWTGEYEETSHEASLYLRAADACVFPFIYGVTLNRSSVAAAAAHGVPIVTTKGSILESPFIDGENVLLCPPQDANSVAHAVESLISNPGLRERLAAGAFDLARRYFSWESAVQRTLSVLQA